MADMSKSLKPPQSSSSKALRYVIVAIIYVVFTLAAVVLGCRVQVKNTSVLESNRADVYDHWGSAIAQYAPTISFLFEPARYNSKGELVTDAVMEYETPESNIDVEIISSPRTSGKMRFPGYQVSFNATYVFSNPFDAALPAHFNMMLPQDTELESLDSLEITVDGEIYNEDHNYANGIDWEKNMAPGETHTITVTYNSRGTGNWEYVLSNYRDLIPLFKLHLTTDFVNIDYPEGTMAADTMVIDKDEGTADLTWTLKNSITGQNIGVVIPEPVDVGKATANIMYFVPLGLIFFLGIILLLTSIKGTPLHPMHYLFLTGGFFVFHVLMSYLPTLMQEMASGVLWAFLISFAASALMTLIYSTLIRKGKVVIWSTALGIALFQVGFSLAQFVPKFRGLILALIIIAGLGIAMGFTARVDWKGKL
ncbi:hypothetical protein GF359_04220 [candidate division WOR-3 bacterium]|uniref:Cell envelope integrity protein CreD n=1 Tax=candidate division WOR-3 bacterium TaxID=2052148 RepID=A0A9D5K947_UNCW3|nr:hypothetical protein [candidate division WOR-3 bacterium]MBD3364404.1 hypothetical protein [candidate division WOR-3 bacterium]